jgi:DNA-binding GntR family transcriptional regulator
VHTPPVVEGRPSSDPLAQSELRTGTVYQRLRQAILHGAFELDTPLSQVKLAERLGVSRTPLREALRMLQREGLITAEPNRRIRVTPLSLDDLEQVYAQRIMLEGLAISLSAPQATAADYEEIRSCLDTMHRIEQEHDTRGEVADDVERWEMPHRRFHLVLRRHAGERINHDATILSEHSERYRRVYLAEGSAWRVAAEEHEAIARAYRDRKVDLARELLGRHLARTALTVLATVAPEHDPSRVRTALQFVIAGPPAAVEA